MSDFTISSLQAKSELGLYSGLIKPHHNYTSDVSEFIVELMQDIAVTLYASKTFGDAVLL